MQELRLRPMTPEEFDVFRSRLIDDYADDQVRAGSWAAQEGRYRATELIDGLLPDGAGTAGMLVLTAQNAEGDAVGHVWIALRRQSDPPDSAWIYDIEVRPERRGSGYGRALLRAAEREAAGRGIAVMGLNVFAHNEVARSLYVSAGYDLTRMEMRKALADD